MWSAEELLEVAERVDADRGFDGWKSFCEAIGVTIESQRIARELACGTGYLGWVPNGARKEIERKAGVVLGRAKARLAKRLLEDPLEEE